MVDKRVERGEQTYNRIMMAAIDIISEEGVSEITASNLSQRVGVSKSNIFHHFKATSDIPIAVLKMMLDELKQPMNEEAFEDVEVLLNCMEQSVFGLEGSHNKLHRAFFSFYNASLFNKTYQEILSTFLISTELEVTKLLLKCVGHKFDVNQVSGYARLIIACLDGIGLHILMGSDKEAYLESWKIQKKLIVNEMTK